MKMSLTTKIIVGWMLAVALLIVAASHIPAYSQEVPEFDVTKQVTTVQDMRNLRTAVAMGDTAALAAIGGYTVGVHEFMWFVSKYGVGDAALNACADMPTTAFATMLKGALDDVNKYPGHLPMFALIGTECQAIALLIGTAEQDPV